MNKIAIITISLVPEAKETSNSQIEKEISNSIECDWLLKTQKVTILEKR
ncbi:MAG: hypothetical protein NWF01_09255 [Candidatus Bathyarchaeota archaeon]|nr:hypothetical protein [Candidatus Bathyarchaeota archaeon]